MFVFPCSPHRLSQERLLSHLLQSGIAACFPCFPSDKRSSSGALSNAGQPASPRPVTVTCPATNQNGIVETGCKGVQLDLPGGRSSTDASQGPSHVPSCGPSTNRSWHRVGAKHNHIFSQILTIFVAVHFL